MIDSQQMLTLFEDIQAFLTPQIQNGKCILVVGSRSSGKTCLIKYFSGVAFTRDTNEEDLPFLVQNPDVVPQVQVKLFAKQKISLQLTLLKTYDVNSQEVTIIEMPSFASLTSQSEQQEQTPGMLTFNKIIYGIFTWNTVLNLAKQVHIFLLAPYQFITDDHKLVEFFSIWQKCLIQNEQFRAQIKQCLTIIFTKPEYEDDKQSLITSLDHLSQSGSQQIGLNNSFSSAAESSRVFCFLSQDTQQGQGPELLNNIMQEADFYLSSQNGLLATDWAQSFMWSIIKQSGDEKLKQVLKLVESMFKKIIESEQKASKTFQKSLSIIANASILSLIKSLPKQSQLKKKQKQVQQQIKQKIKQQPIITNELISKIEANVQKTDKILNGFIKITAIIQSAIKEELMFQQLVDNVERQFWLIFGVDDESRNVISHWINQRLFIWKYPSIFSKLCSQHKDNIQLQHQTQAIDDLNKEMTTKLSRIMKQKIGNGLKYYQIVQKLGQIKAISDTDCYKQLSSTYKTDTTQQSQQQQQQKSGQQNPLIKRWYFKTEQNIDWMTIIKEKSKKVVIKQVNKKQEINEREQIKILLSVLEREPENRKQNLVKLAKKLVYFQFYQFALETYMDLADPILIYQFVTQCYCRKVKDNHVEFMRGSLIPYLEEKAAIASLYMDKEQAQYFVYTAQFCYDFLAVNFAETAEEYVEITTLSNEIQIADEKQFEEEELKDLDVNLSTFGVSNNKDMQFLKYISFSKAEIIEKINERDQKNKKNGLAYNQIKKFLEAPKIELKAK